MPTGIEGFDEIADAGLPRVVLGGAGAGKTTCWMQTLAKGERPFTLEACSYARSPSCSKATTAFMSRLADLPCGPPALLS